MNGSVEGGGDAVSTVDQLQIRVAEIEQMMLADPATIEPLRLLRDRARLELAAAEAAAERARRPTRTEMEEE
jgi:hypothetical protein